jgi:hypothetical protein
MFLFYLCSENKISSYNMYIHNQNVAELIFTGALISYAAQFLPFGPSLAYLLLELIHKAKNYYNIKCIQHYCYYIL